MAPSAWNGADFLAATLLSAEGRWPEDVSIWRLDLPLSYDCPRERNQVAACYAGLDAAERSRADRYRVVGERIRFVITRATLRQVLGAQTGVPASAIHFTTIRNGRPALFDYPGLSFNVSHAGDHALIALSHHRVVGVDIEHINVETNWQSLVDIVCSERQREQLRTAPGTFADARSAAYQRSRFFQCWTAKEAILKALGIGLTDHLPRIDFSLDAMGVQHPVSSEPGLSTELAKEVDKEANKEAAGLSFHWLTDIDGYIGCIAYSNAVAHVAAGTAVG